MTMACENPIQNTEGVFENPDMDIDNLGYCPSCSRDLTISLVHHNTGLVTCANLDVSTVEIKKRHA